MFMKVLKRVKASVLIVLENIIEYVTKKYIINII